jgi:hypothetical protein
LRNEPRNSKQRHFTNGLLKFKYDNIEWHKSIAWINPGLLSHVYLFLH